MRKFSTSLLALLNIGMLLLQWQCSRKPKTTQGSIDSAIFIPNDWDGRSDYLPADIQLRELE